MPETLSAALFTIGDELLIGQVLNSNAQWLSEKLTDLGIGVTHHLTVGDSPETIKSALTFLQSTLLPSEKKILVIGGGLGPTHDDLTMEVLSDFFSIPLEYDADWISKVEVYFKSRNRVMSENNKKQGFLLKNVTRIDNDCGTAAGQYFQISNQNHSSLEIFVVPGVPHEMKSMAERFILPKISSLLSSLVLSRASNTLHQKILKKSLLITGIGESALALKCDDFVQKIKSLKKEGKNISLAFLPNASLIRLRLQMTITHQAEENLFSQLCSELENRCGHDFYGYDPLTLEELIVGEMGKKNQTLALAESCTGGLIAHKLTQVPGSSTILRGALVAYQRTLKETDLNIAPTLIDTYGIVSEPVAMAMAESIRKKWNTTFALSTTGFLGPTASDKDDASKLGLVWIALATPTQTFTKSFNFENHRERNKERAAQAALDLLRRNLK